MEAHISAARHRAALPAGNVIGGIQRSAFFTGITLNHLRVPFFISNFLYALLGFPQLDSVRHLGLKRFQVFTGIFRAFTAKIHSLCRRASRHGTFALAVKAALFRPASVALDLLKRPLKAPGHRRKPSRVLSGPDEYVARRTKQPADRGKAFVGCAKTFISIFHEFSPS